MVAKRLAKIEAARAAAIPPRLLRRRGRLSRPPHGLGLGQAADLRGPRRAGRKDIAYLHFPGSIRCRRASPSYMAKAKSCYAIEGNATGQFADLVELGTMRRLDGASSSATASSTPSKSSRTGSPRSPKKRDSMNDNVFDFEEKRDIAWCPGCGDFAIRSFAPRSAQGARHRAREIW
jgi:hypothetical protein